MQTEFLYTAHVAKGFIVFFITSSFHLLIASSPSFNHLSRSRMSSGTSSKIEKQKWFYKIHAQNSYPVDASIFNLMTIKNGHSEK